MVIDRDSCLRVLALPSVGPVRSLARYDTCRLGAPPTEADHTSNPCRAPWSGTVAPRESRSSERSDGAVAGSSYD